VNRRVAAGSPTRALSHKRRVIGHADEDRAVTFVDSLILGVATQAKIRVIAGKHLPVDRAMRIVAGGATFAHGFMLEHHGPRLLTMTFGATLVLPRHRELPRRFHDVAAVRIVALHAIHFAFDDRVMLRETEFSAGFEMALKTGSRVFAGIEDEFPRSDLHVKAAGAVAGFTAGLPGHRAFKMNSRVRAGGKFLCDGRMAIRATFVADKMRAGNLRCREYGARDRGAGIHKHHGRGHRQNGSPTQKFFLIHVTTIDQSHRMSPDAMFGGRVCSRRLVFMHRSRKTDGVDAKCHIQSKLTGTFQGVVTLNNDAVVCLPSWTLKA